MELLFIIVFTLVCLLFLYCCVAFVCLGCWIGALKCSCVGFVGWFGLGRILVCVYGVDLLCCLVCFMMWFTICGTSNSVVRFVILLFLWILLIAGVR